MFLVKTMTEPMKMKHPYHRPVQNFLPACAERRLAGLSCWETRCTTNRGFSVSESICHFQNGFGNSQLIVSFYPCFSYSLSFSALACPGPTWATSSCFCPLWLSPIAADLSWWNHLRYEKFCFHLYWTATLRETLTTIHSESGHIHHQKRKKHVLHFAE